MLRGAWCVGCGFWLAGWLGGWTARGDKAYLGAGDAEGQGLVDDGGQAVLEPVKSKGAGDLDGPGVVLDVDDAAAAEAVVEGGAGHSPLQGFQDCLPALFY